MSTRYKVTSIILLSVFLFIISGCSQHYIAELDSKQARTVPYTIVSSGKPGANVASAPAFALMTDRHEIYGEPTLGGIPVNVFLDSAIGIAMTGKGYRLAKVEVEHILLVGYQIVLGNTQEGEQIGSHYDSPASPGVRGRRTC
jgi:hypothetical protein